MPQLDKLSFLNQLIWFFFLYIIFYFLMLKTFIPTIGRSLKLRTKLLQNLTDTSTNSAQESTKILTLAQKLNSEVAVTFSLLGTATSYKATFLNILTNNKSVQVVKGVYVKELTKLLAKKKILEK
jgi:hypothetical protein